MKNWYLIHNTQNNVEAAIVKGLLEENNIPVQILNKQSSSYIVLGNIEVYVPVHLKDVAITVINKALLN